MNLLQEMPKKKKLQNESAGNVNQAWWLEDILTEDEVIGEVIGLLERWASCWWVGHKDREKEWQWCSWWLDE